MFSRTIFTATFFIFLPRWNGAPLYVGLSIYQCPFFLKLSPQGRCAQLFVMLTDLLLEISFTLYHTITTINNPPWETFRKHCRKGENTGNQHFIVFPQCFLSISEQILFSQLHLFCSSYEQSWQQRKKLINAWQKYMILAGFEPGPPGW